MVAGVEFGDPAFAADVRDGVARIEDLMSTELGKADELMAEAVQHLFQAGGKRFRPLFTVLTAQLGPDPDNSQVTVAGAVIELVHLATLYHDDVMDEAQCAAAPSANARWATTSRSWPATICSRRRRGSSPGSARTRCGSSPRRSPSWSPGRCARLAAPPTTSTPSSTT